MAKRTVHLDSKGLFFKGEGFKFYLTLQTGFKAGDKVTVTSVSCGQAGALASFKDAQGFSRTAAAVI